MKCRQKGVLLTDRWPDTPTHVKLHKFQIHIVWQKLIVCITILPTREL